MTISETGEASLSEIVRCPDCTSEPSRTDLLKGISRVVTWDDWKPSVATTEAEAAVISLLTGGKWCVFLRGQYGIGKTMLAQIAAWEFTATGKPAVFVNVPDFLASLRETFDDDNRNTSRETYAARFEAYAEAPFLVLDDLGAESRKEWTREQVYRVIDRRYQRRAPTIVTSNSKYDSELDPRVISRLGPGEIVIKGVEDQRRVYE
ncbi:MAG: ATP-binding protein [Acidobacteriota bacterium]|nr:ATP-binding protein [Acidobacteriota bacterium]